MHDQSRMPPPLPRQAIDAALARGPAATIAMSTGSISTSAGSHVSEAQAARPSAPVMRASSTERLDLARRAPSRGLGRYGTAWGLAGLAATGYLGAVLVGQEPVSNIAARWSAQERDATEVAAALARTQSDVAQLQRSVGALEADIGRVKTQVVQQDTREKDLSGRVTAVEGRVERFATQLTQVFAKAAPPTKGSHQRSWRRHDQGLRRSKPAPSLRRT